MPRLTWTPTLAIWPSSISAAARNFLTCSSSTPRPANHASCCRRRIATGSISATRPASCGIRGGSSGRANAAAIVISISTTQTVISLPSSLRRLGGDLARRRRRGSRTGLLHLDRSPARSSARSTGLDSMAPAPPPSPRRREHTRLSSHPTRTCSSIPTPTALLRLGRICSAVTAPSSRRSTRIQSRALAAYKLPPVEFLTVKTHMGADLNALMIRPPDFDPARKYPVIVYMGGGPGEQVVRDVWGGDIFLWLRMMAQKGYLIYAQDGHGTAGRGHLFEEPLHLRFSAAGDGRSARWRPLSSLAALCRSCTRRHLRMGLWRISGPARHA